MADPSVREIGRIDVDGHPFVVGIDHGAVTLAFPGVRAAIGTETADELTAHLITAIWQAGGVVPDA
jgi:hypothetical protein